MKLGIMQPYFFPYLGYFDLIRQTDAWVVFDTPQYIRHGWVNRNRILHPKQSWQYILVPLKKHARETPIHQISIAENPFWKQRIVDQFAHYRKRARYYGATLDLLQDCFAHNTTSLCELNIRCLERVCQYVGIPFHCQRSSEIDYDMSEVAGPGDWALAICRRLRATGYLNPPGGADLFDQAKYSDHGIELQIQQYRPMVYDTRNYVFEPGLSILDVLMWCRPEEIVQHLQQGQGNATI